MAVHRCQLADDVLVGADQSSERIATLERVPLERLDAFRKELEAGFEAEGPTLIEVPL